MSESNNKYRKTLKDTSYSAEEIKKLKERAKKEIYEHLLWADQLRELFGRNEFKWIIDDFAKGLTAKTESGKNLCTMRFTEQDGISVIFGEQMNESLSAQVITGLLSQFVETYYKLRGLHTLVNRESKSNQISDDLKRSITDLIEQTVKEGLRRS